jgi:hypothetical protein
MSAKEELYPVAVREIEEATASSGLRITTVRRLALLAVGLVAGKSSVVGQMASGLWERGVSTVQLPSIARRLRRCLHDPKVKAETCYTPALGTLVNWAGLLKRGKPVVLALDESSQDERVHLLRVSLTYWGTALPLAWKIWPQNTPLEDGAYWEAMDEVLARVATIVPAGLEVIMTADRAFDIPPFIDRIASRGWHWVVRLKANGATRFLDAQHREHAVKTLIRRHVAAPGQRWKARGRLFKNAGWRAASIIAVWAPGAQEALVIVTDLPPRWEVLRFYDRRFWIEAGFRIDTSSGWQWEDCQVTNLQHLERLLIAMAWATLLALRLGLQDARARLHAVTLARRATATRPASRRPPIPQPAHESLFTIGLRLARRWLSRPDFPPESWTLTHLASPAWSSRWRQAQSHRYLFSQTVRT